jgi:hypothetical protein
LIRLACQYYFAKINICSILHLIRASIRSVLSAFIARAAGWPPVFELAHPFKKGTTMNKLHRFVAALALIGAAGVCGTALASPKAAPANTPQCPTVRAIEGTYQCSGECVVRGADSVLSVIKVPEEVDRVERFPGSAAGIYQVAVTGGGGFRELEIGPLVGHTLSTATADVTDKQYPVLEEYVFQSGPQCLARGFTKTARNPSNSNFKACVLKCVKQAAPRK